MAIFEAVSSRLRPGVALENSEWEARYRTELPRVLNYFRYRVGELATAEDLTSVTFEKAWVGRARYQDAGKFSAWLMTIARNVAADHFKLRRQHLPIDAAGEALTPGSLEQDVENKEATLRLRTLLQSLPDQHRELIALKYGAELTNRNIARLTGLSESNVGTTLHRLVRQLRTQWEAEA